MNVGGKSLDRQVDHVDRGAYFFAIGRGEIRLVDLDVLASRRRQALEVLVEQLPQVDHHPANIVVILVVGYRCQQMRSAHRDLDRLVRK